MFNFRCCWQPRRSVVINVITLAIISGVHQQGAVHRERDLRGVDEHGGGHADRGGGGVGRGAGHLHPQLPLQDLRVRQLRGARDDQRSRPVSADVISDIILAVVR